MVNVAKKTIKLNNKAKLGLIIIVIIAIIIIAWIFA